MVRTGYVDVFLRTASAVQIPRERDVAAARRNQPEWRIDDGGNPSGG